jgi:PAS domain S-box-containing protein/putative nucleotidyltransferase with HDIG domain
MDERNPRTREQRADVSTSMLDVILRYTPDHLYFCDPDGRFVFASRSALDALGLEMEQMAGKTGQELRLPGDFMDAMDAARIDALAQDRPSCGEVSFPTAGGGRHLEYTVAPVHGAGDGAPGVVVTMRDVSERAHVESVLAAEKAFSDAVIDAAPGLFYTADRDGRLVRWNAALAAGLSVDADGAAGINLLDRVGGDDHDRAAAAIEDVMETGAGQVQIRIAMPDGPAHYVMNGRRVEISGAPYLVGFGMDVTDRVLAEDEVLRARDELEHRVEERTAELRAANLRLKRTERALLTLSWSNQTLVRATDSQRLLQDVCDAAVEVGGYRMAWVGHVEDGGTAGVRSVAHAGADDGFLSEAVDGWDGGPEGQGSVGRCIRTLRPVLVGDIANDEEPGPWRDAAASHGYGSTLSLPLIDRNGVALGVFCLFAGEVDAFDDREIALLEELAMDLSFGIDSLRSRIKRAEAEEGLQESYARLEMMMRDVVESMGRIVEARDPYTQGHERRVAELSKAIGAEMGLSQDDLAAVEMAAMLHDIGKLCVPAEILTKPGTLSLSEFELIKDHSRRGYEILKDIAFPWPIADIVLQHHERVDGSGYPGKLKGDQILPLARILAVADVVEAMASHRPYRPLIGLGPAMEEIHEHPGAYDREVVAATERLYERGLIDL